MRYRTRFRHVATLTVALTALMAGCDNNEFFPTQSAGGGIGDGSGGGGGGGGGAGGNIAFTDPPGDLLPGTRTPDAPDVVSISGGYDAESLTLTITFAGVVNPWSEQLDSSLDGFVDLDIDEDASTGIRSAVDDHGGDARIGAEYYIALRDAGATTVSLVHPASKAILAVPITYDGGSVTVRVPRAALGDTDGRLRMAMVVGNPASPATDIAPNDGNWTIVAK